MRFHFLLVLISILFCEEVIGQSKTPENGVKPSEPRVIALKNARIIVSSEKTIEKGTLLIKEGRVKSVGLLVNIPKDAVVIDLKGKTIVPAFIESHSNIGLPEVKKEKWNPRPQLSSKKEGAFYWNESIQPEVDASVHFNVDQKAVKSLQEMGFGVAITHRQDGIMRGVGAAVALGNHSHNEALIKHNVAAFFSFDKGVSRQSYPSSQMGAIALMRQALLDAEHYQKNTNRKTVNLSLEALNNQLSLPLLMDVGDKLEVLRAQKVANEFGLMFTCFGGGNEYERLQEIKASESPLILPLNFPDAYEVGDPFVARQIPLSSLKEWELAPANPYLLAKEGVTFGLTSKGIKKSADFWKNLHKAMEKGLTASQAIAALTEIPAQLFQLEGFGTLDSGKVASFSVFDIDPFEYENAEIRSFWSMGKEHQLKESVEIDIRGDYNLNIAGKYTYPISIKGKKEKPSGEITVIQEVAVEDSAENRMDTIKIKPHITVKEHDVTLYFNVHDSQFDGAVTLHGKFNEKIGVIEGQGSLPNGNWVKWAAIKNKKFKEETPPKKIEVDTSFIPKAWFPNMAYGFDSMPGKQTFVIRNATLWTNEEAGIIKEGNLIIKDGKINHVGSGSFAFPAGAIEINAKGLHVTSGIIDEHSHIAISKGVNESGQSVSAEVTIEDVVRSNDINIYRQLSGGVTASQLLHGSANAIGGRSALIKLKWGHAPEEMIIKDAPKFIKFALGENVKQANWGSFNTVRFPQTRMGVEQVFYDAFMRAEKYHQEWEAYNAIGSRKREKDNVLPPARDLELETLWEIMNGERFISCHSYIQSEINMLMHVADSMGFTVNTFTHILEGYKLADKMINHGAGASTFSDWWAYKFEVNDAIPYNASLMNEQGLTVAINSDDAEMGRRLNQEAAKVIKYGGATEEEAWKMVTLNPAKLLHLDDRMGSLKVGKDADVVIWSANPLTTQAKVITSFIDGERLYDYKLDEQKRSLNKQEKARIISLMLDDNKKGNPAKTFVKKKEHHWHCDTIGQGEENH